MDFVLKQELFKIIDQTLKKTKVSNILCFIESLTRLLISLQVLQNNGYHFFIDPDYPDLGRMCITEQAKKFAKWEKKDPEPGEYYNHYPYVDIYQAVDKVCCNMHSNSPFVRIFFNRSISVRKLVNT